MSHVFAIQAIKIQISHAKSDINDLNDDLRAELGSYRPNAYNVERLEIDIDDLQYKIECLQRSITALEAIQE